ncbi:MAG: ArsR family transcriptional regulator [Methanobacterium sp. ERen5]|nr:MAG: ArsR family transcriptional regulator [Methanobacterium sp. ERen5]
MMTNKDAGTLNQIKIFGTKNGLNIVNSPIKSKILEILEENERSGAEVVKLTGKSKATISAHLNDLVEMGIIESKPNPKDGRSKIFFIKSSYLGDLTRKNDFNKELDDYITEGVVNSEDPFAFFRFVFRTFRVALIEEGVNIDPILHNAGIKVGETFYNNLKDSQTDSFIDNIADFWQKNKLGKIKTETLEPLTLKAYDCFECEDLPKIGRSACTFDSGILEAIFSAHFGHKVDVEEIKCFAKGDDYCSFVVK